MARINERLLLSKVLLSKIFFCPQKSGPPTLWLNSLTAWVYYFGYTLTHRSRIGQVSAGGGLRGSTLVLQSGRVHHRVGGIHLTKQIFIILKVTRKFFLKL